MDRLRLLSCLFGACCSWAASAEPAADGRLESPAPIDVPVGIDVPVAPRAPFTVEALAAHGFLDGGQAQANAAYLRGTWDRDNGDTARVELLDEHKFGSHGGLVGGAYSHALSPDWLLAGAAAFGHGGPNWANERADVELTTKWLPSRSLLTRIAVYGARYDAGRSDIGLRASLVWYLPAHVVFEGGFLANVSQPGSVDSSQRFASITWGVDGEQYLSARFSGGTEAYQTIGEGRQLVGFRSKSLGVTWRRWLAKDWGFLVQTEHYANPSYRRQTVAAGVFVQW